MGDNSGNYWASKLTMTCDNETMNVSLVQISKNGLLVRFCGETDIGGNGGRAVLSAHMWTRFSGWLWLFPR